MILNKSKVEEAAESFIIKEHLDGDSDMYYRETFGAGVEFAESKLENILKEYTEYLGIETNGSLIEQFIRWKNNK